MYKVVKRFADLKDNSTIYDVGDTYPRKNYKPSDERLAELASDKNKQGTPLIKEVKPTPKTNSKKTAKK